MHWYVKVDNQAYGPYADDQMRGFVTEGRVTTSSLISNAPDTGFFGAAEFDAFNLWHSAGQQSVEQPLVAIGGGGAVATPTSLYAPIQQASQQAPLQNQPSYQTSYQASNQRPQQTIDSTVDNRAAQSVENIQASLSEKSGVFLIMAEIRSEGEMAFLQTMQNFGKAQRIGDTVWLVRSGHTVEQIRNTLSQTLDQQDRLFILDTSAGKTAWFNMGADLDHRIRELWDEDEG